MQLLGEDRNTRVLAGTATAQHVRGLDSLHNQEYDNLWTTLASRGSPGCGKARSYCPIRLAVRQHLNLPLTAFSCHQFLCVCMYGVYA